MICGPSRAALCAAGMLLLSFRPAAAQETAVVSKAVEPRAVTLAGSPQPVQCARELVAATIEAEMAELRLARELVASVIDVQDPPKPPTSRPRQTVPVRTAQRPRPSTPNHRGFSVVLVLADLKASGAQDDVPPAAQRALADMKDFLPYKSYRLLDAAWVLGQGQQTIRLRGPEGRDYELRLSTHGDASDERVPVQFSLREAEAADEAMTAALVAEAADASAREQLRRRLQIELEQARQKKDEKRAETIERQLAEMDIHGGRSTTSVRRKVPGSRPIIDTTFTMKVGETVVVGTSRLRENSSALIALLTAVPPRSGARETR